MYAFYFVRHVREISPMFFDMISQRNKEGKGGRGRWDWEVGGWEIYMYCTRIDVSSYENEQW